MTNKTKYETAFKVGDRVVYRNEDPEIHGTVERIEGDCPEITIFTDAGEMVTIRRDDGLFWE